MARVAVIVGKYPQKEWKRRVDCILSYATSDIEIGIVRTRVAPYSVGRATPYDIALMIPGVLEAIEQAEREGYQAVVPLGTLDLGVEASRYRAKIPVVGPAMAMFHMAALVADRFGLLVYHSDIIPYMRNQAAFYGFADRVIGIRSVEVELGQLSRTLDVMKKRFRALARELIEAGAEAILPAGITMCPVLQDPRELAQELGVPVVEAIGAPIQLAGSLVQLGLKPSAKRYPRTD